MRPSPTTGNAVEMYGTLLIRTVKILHGQAQRGTLFGETIDLSGYMKNDALQEITATEVEALFK